MPAMSWQFYQQMRTIRRVEETLLHLYSRGLVFGTVHTCIGQEAVAVGVVNALDRARDVIWSNHRGHGHFLAYCDDVDGLIAEVMGKPTGVCGGVGGTQHLHTRNFYTNGVLGGTVPCGVGAALAEKARGAGAIAAIFMGDGAMGQGVVYESLNLAALWQLPALFILEHNGIAQSTPARLEHAGDLATRAQTFGIECAQLQADDVEKIHAAAQRAVSVVRGESRPYFLVLHTTRLMPHSKGDDTRPPAELDDLRARDPLPRLRASLLAEDPARLARLEAAIETRLAAAVDAAM
jgi:TPP-dependent pyruvate/acetoin dehydrogenase alpha subunit